MAKLIFLNAPPRAGKDTIATYLEKRYTNVIHLKFAEHLKRVAHAMLGLYNVPSDAFENCKDSPNIQFPFNIKTHDNFTPREWYIYVAETVIKPIMGIRHFGCVLSKLIDPSVENDALYIVSDSGFQEEADPIIELLGAENCYQIQLYREGYDFTSDSRSYWKDNRILTFKVNNNSSKDELFKQVEQILTYPIGGIKYDYIRK